MIQKLLFGRLSDGREAHIYTLENRNGMTVKITDFGATVVSIIVADQNGKFQDVTFGYDDVEGYSRGTHFFGATVGRYANRIAKGRFSLDGELYTLPVNDGGNTLHGGPAGFHKRLWIAEPMETDEGPALRLTYVSEDGEEGFPGTVTASATFTVTSDDSLRVRFTATTDRPTVINMTYHNYFNLGGNPETTILDHELMIGADHYTPVDDSQIPTGLIAPVTGTPVDFRKPTVIGLRIDDDFEQLKSCRGYDLNWALNDANGHVRKAAELYHPHSGRLLEVYTDQPGMQFYSGNFLDGSQIGKGGVAYKFRTALALETQHFPDSPNKPEFPSTILFPGEVYDTTTTFKFSVRAASDPTDSRK